MNDRKFRRDTARLKVALSKPDAHSNSGFITDHASYDAMAKAHVALSATDRDMMIVQLNNAYNQFEKEALQVTYVRVQLYNTYNRKVLSNQAVSVLSRDFNMSLKGHNTELSTRLGKNLARAYKEETSCRPSQAIKILLEAGLSLTYLTSEEIITILKANEQRSEHAKIAMSLLRQIDQYQEALFRSVIWLATKVAKKATWQGSHAVRGGNTQWKKLAGDVIEESDMIQEAVIAAKFAVKAYKPGLHNGLSFTSFVYSYVSGMLSKFVNENTRVVAIPRKVMDRYIPLQQVIDSNPILTQYGQFDYEAIAREVSESKEGTPYSAVEVEWLLLNVSKETASLDLEVADDYDGTTPITLGESLINPIGSQEVLIDRVTLKEKLLKVIREHTSIQEYTVLKLRWGGGKLLSLDQTAKAYIRLTDLDMNKGKVAVIEREVFDRLKNSKDPRFEELLDVLNDFSEEKQHTMIDIQDGVVRCGGRRMTA